MDTAKYLAWELTNRTLYLFYMVDPRDNVFEKVEDVPSYGAIVFPGVVFLIFLELCVRLFYKDYPIRVNDAIGSFYNGMLWELTRLWTHGVEAIVYSWIYNNFRVADVDIHSYKLWVFCMFYTDFAYYVLHRSLHEINLLWALHQVHHSSEDYNMAVTFRLEILRPFVEWIAHVPIAIFVPPSMFFVHFELHFFTQVWIHSKLIKKMGYLDWILNTPSNHRVHHGRNRRCIDKNFGGILMIWDHLFGTYEAEGDGDDIQYGLTTPLKSFNPLYVQFHPFVDMYRKIRDYEGIGNKLSVLFKGPGWAPGKPRLGNLEEIPEHYDEEKYDPPLSLGMKALVSFQFYIFTLGYLDAIYYPNEMDAQTKRVTVAFLFLSSVTNTFFIDKRRNAPLWEILRCAIYLCFPTYCLPCLGFPWTRELIIRPFMIGSLVLWTSYVLGTIIPLNKFLEIAKEVNENNNTFQKSNHPIQESEEPNEKLKAC